MTETETLQALWRVVQELSKIKDTVCTELTSQHRSLAGCTVGRFVQEALKVEGLTIPEEPKFRQRQIEARAVWCSNYRIFQLQLPSGRTTRYTQSNFREEWEPLNDAARGELERAGQ